MWKPRTSMRRTTALTELQPKHTFSIKLREMLGLVAGKICTRRDDSDGQATSADD